VLVLDRIPCGTCFAADRFGSLVALARSRDDLAEKAADELTRIRAGLAG
jgi:hypothetical protein